MFYPIMLDIQGRNIMIVGGGKVAYRKAKNILEFGGVLTILSPEIIQEFGQLKEKYGESLNLIYDLYDEKYIQKAFLVVAATSSRKVNKQIGLDCENLNILINRADSKNESDFIMPSIISNDNLTISISTMGSFPYLSKKIRMDMEKNYEKFNREYIMVLEELRHILLKKDINKIKDIMDEALKLEITELKDLLGKYKNDL